MGQIVHFMIYISVRFCILLLGPIWTASNNIPQPNFAVGGYGSHFLKWPLAKCMRTISQSIMQSEASAPGFEEPDNQ